MRYADVEDAHSWDIPMFGMLDYRAYKLLWLITRPIWLLGKAAYFGAIFVAIWIGHSTGYSSWVKIIIGYVAFEAILLVVMAINAIIMWIIKKCFFWLIDVIPSRGVDGDEAREIVIKGPIIWLAQKLVSQIEEWMDKDTDAMVALMNWRSRLFFDARAKFQKRVEIFQRMYWDRGLQPQEIPQQEMKRLVGHLDGGWLEKAIVFQWSFNALVGACLIIFGVKMLE